MSLKDAIKQFIEEETGLRVPDAEVILENFESVSTVDALVHRLRSRIRGHDTADA